MRPGRASKAFPRGTWRKTTGGLCVPRYTFLIVGRGTLGDRVHDVVRASSSCLQAQIVAPERALAWICSDRPDHALFCGPDRHAELEAVRELVAASPAPPSTAFGLADATPAGEIVLAAHAL